MENTVTFGLWSLLPPVLAIGLALLTRKVFVSLITGVVAGWIILLAGGGDIGAATVAVVTSAGNLRILAFTLVVGALIALIQANGGVAGFVARVLGSLERASDAASARGRRVRVELLAVATGLVLFIESNISILTVGTIYRPVFDRLGVPREKLAYIADSSSAPSCILLPFNAWGAFIAGLLLEQGVRNGFGAVLSSIAYNFYPMLVIAGLVIVIVSGRDVGPMRRAEARGTLLRDGAVPMMGEDVAALEPKTGAPQRAVNMLVPIGVMVGMMPLMLVATGSGEGFARLQSGSGSLSVLVAVSVAVGVAVVMSVAQNILSATRAGAVSVRGMRGMVPLAGLMLLAFLIGAVCRELGTGLYVAGLAEPWLSPALLPALVFTISAVVAFSTGTSWGTFAIMIAIAVPLAQSVGVPLPLAVAAALGGGVFGDHASPISDTSIISSMASASDHIDHVRTQLPYALLAGAVTVAAYLVLGSVSHG